MRLGLTWFRGSATDIILNNGKELLIRMIITIKLIYLYFCLLKLPDLVKLQAAQLEYNARNSPLDNIQTLFVDSGGLWLQGKPLYQNLEGSGHREENVFLSQWCEGMEQTPKRAESESKYQSFLKWTIFNHCTMMLGTEWHDFSVLYV